MVIKPQAGSCSANKPVITLYVSELSPPSAIKKWQRRAAFVTASCTRVSPLGPSGSMMSPKSKAVSLATSTP